MAGDGRGAGASDAAGTSRTEPNVGRVAGDNEMPRVGRPERQPAVRPA